MRISYSEDALKDLVRLREFIESKNPQAVHEASVILQKGISQLKEFPRLGVKASLAPEPNMIRDLIIRNYLVRYLITTDVIYILRI